MRFLNFFLLFSFFLGKTKKKATNEDVFVSSVLNSQYICFSNDVDVELSISFLIIKNYHNFDYYLLYLLF